MDCDTTRDTNECTTEVDCAAAAHRRQCRAFLQQFDGDQQTKKRPATEDHDEDEKGTVKRRKTEKKEKRPTGADPVRAKKPVELQTIDVTKYVRGSGTWPPYVTEPLRNVWGGYIHDASGSHDTVYQFEIRTEKGLIGQIEQYSERGHRHMTEIPFPTQIVVRGGARNVKMAAQLRARLADGRIARAFRYENHEGQTSQPYLVIKFGKSVEDDLADLPAFEAEKKRAADQKARDERVNDLMTKLHATTTVADFLALLPPAVVDAWNEDMERVKLEEMKKAKSGNWLENLLKKHVT